MHARRKAVCKCVLCEHVHLHLLYCEADGVIYISAHALLLAGAYSIRKMNCRSGARDKIYLSPYVINRACLFMCVRVFPMDAQTAVQIRTKFDTDVVLHSRSNKPGGGRRLWKPFWGQNCVKSTYCIHTRSELGWVQIQANPPSQTEALLTLTREKRAHWHP